MLARGQCFPAEHAYKLAYNHASNAGYAGYVAVTSNAAADMLLQHQMPDMMLSGKLARGQCFNARHAYKHA